VLPNAGKNNDHEARGNEVAVKETPPRAAGSCPKNMLKDERDRLLKSLNQRKAPTIKIVEGSIPSVMTSLLS